MCSQNLGRAPVPHVGSNLSSKRVSKKEINSSSAALKPLTELYCEHFKNVRRLKKIPL